MTDNTTCKACKGNGWVCENHPTLSWDDECACGAGIPCEWCNGDDNPRNPTGFTVISDENGVRH